MFSVNEHYLDIKQSYIFTEIAARVRKFSEENPDKKIIRMGIGDVTLPLAETVVKALVKASQEMGVKETFRGYGPEQGYDFLREKIGAYYAEMGVTLEDGEVFVSDGAKSDVANITDLFGNDNVVLICDPVYPVYVDTNRMLGRTIRFLKGDERNGFLPMPPSFHGDIIYLCSPNNPTGAVYDRAQLKAWVDYAKAEGAIILFDAAYESFIEDASLPRSIYEIDGAKDCAIEFCSLSKTAGFTGTRCGYTVVPKGIEVIAKSGKTLNLNAMWTRRQTTKFNGVPYIIQRGAEAVFTPEGLKEIRENIQYYKENAKILAGCFTELGISFTGGINSPYIWLRCPDGMDSWAFFDYLLNGAAVVGTPGAGFGDAGEGYFRLTAFSDRESTLEAVERMKALLKK